MLVKCQKGRKEAGGMEKEGRRRGRKERREAGWKERSKLQGKPTFGVFINI